MQHFLTLENADFYIKEYENAESEISKINVLINVVHEYNMELPEKCLAISEEIIQRSMFIDYKEGLAEGYNYKGTCHWILGDYEEGLDDLTMAYSLAQKLEMIELCSQILINFGRIYRDLGDIANSLRNFEESMELSESLQNELNLSINLINISNLYYDLGDYEPALEYALRVLPIAESRAEVSIVVLTYNTLGSIYYKQALYAEAELYFEKILEIGRSNPLNIAMAKNGLGKVYFNQGNLQASEEYLQMALKIAQANNSFENEIISFYYLSKLYLKKGNPEQALEYALSGFDLTKDYQRRQDILSYHEILSNIYDSLEMTHEAYQHLKSYEKLKEEIFQQATLNKLRNLQIKNQILFAKKEKEVAEKTAHLKQQFMANMSHEIRTPMNAIVGLVNLLMNKNPTDEQKKYLDAIGKSADNLLVIINDILDLSKIEANKVILEKIPFDLFQLSENLYNTLFLRAEEKNLYFNIEKIGNIPRYLIGDPTRVSQILINLLGNAIKFTENGGITLRIQFVEERLGRSVIRFDIIDTGIGIAEDYVNKIFESFTQAGTDTARKYGGTGLGLTISKQLTDLMEGDIQVVSELKKGTTFSVIIPFENSTETALNKETNIEIDKEVLTNLTVLLVEDNEFNVMVAEETMKELLPNVNLHFAENGLVAVNKIKEGQKFDFILMDIQMPVMNGVEATEAIRSLEDPIASSTKIIALTANAFEDDIRKYYRSGMNGYITKPFKQQEFLEEITAVLKDKNKLNNNETLHSEVSTNNEEEYIVPEQITDRTFLNSFTKGDESKVNKYIQMFLSNGPRLMNDIKVSLKNNDYEGVKIAAHSLKPQLGYMGVKEEVSNIYLLEKSAGESAHFSTIEKLVRRLEMVMEQCFKELS